MSFFDEVLGQGQARPTTSASTSKPAATSAAQSAKSASSSSASGGKSVKDIAKLIPPEDPTPAKSKPASAKKSAFRNGLKLPVEIDLISIINGLSTDDVIKLLGSCNASGEIASYLLASSVEDTPGEVAKRFGAKLVAPMLADKTISEQIFAQIIADTALLRRLEAKYTASDTKKLTIGQIQAESVIAQLAKNKTALDCFVAAMLADETTRNALYTAIRAANT